MVLDVRTVVMPLIGRRLWVMPRCSWCCLGIFGDISLRGFKCSSHTRRGLKREANKRRVKMLNCIPCIIIFWRRNGIDVKLKNI